MKQICDECEHGFDKNELIEHIEIDDFENVISKKLLCSDCSMALQKERILKRTMKCDKCKSWFEPDELIKINPKLLDEKLICNDCLQDIFEINICNKCGNYFERHNLHIIKYDKKYDSVIFAFCNNCSLNIS
ncbi:MAG: hypothetical protein ACYCT7_03640 [bacterium]